MSAPSDRVGPALALAERLPEFVLGNLAPAEADEIERALAVTPELRAVADRLTEALVARLVPALTPIAPAPATRSRLLAALDGPARFAPFHATLARLFDLPRETAAALCAKVDDAAAWLRGFAPGLTYFDFTPGPRLQGADAGFIRLAPGARFPRHRHLGRETALIIAGALDLDGTVHGPGTVLEAEPDTEHVFTACGDTPLVMVSAHRGIVPV